MKVCVSPRQFKSVSNKSKKESKKNGSFGTPKRQMKNDEWLTLPEIVAKPGFVPILILCSPINRPFGQLQACITRCLMICRKPWHGRGGATRHSGVRRSEWLRRMAEHGNGIALIPARTETAMFYETVGAADGVLFLEGQPHFHYVDGSRAAFNSGAPISLVAYGEHNLRALQNSGLGVVVTQN